MPTKYQKHLLELLGPEYSLKDIDGAPSVCRKLNSRFEIEISGTIRGAKLCVFVWDISRGTGAGAHMLDRTLGITDEATLRHVLDGYALKYSDLA